jgi:hypothetical protein
MTRLTSLILALSFKLKDGGTADSSKWGQSPFSQSVTR